MNQRIRFYALFSAGLLLIAAAAVPNSVFIPTSDVENLPLDEQQEGSEGFLSSERRKPSEEVSSSSPARLLFNLRRGGLRYADSVFGRRASSHYQSGHRLSNGMNAPLRC